MLVWNVRNWSVGDFVEHTLAACPSECSPYWLLTLRLVWLGMSWEGFQQQ